MKTISIQVPDDFEVPEGYEVQVIKKEEKKPVIRTYQDLVDNNIKLTGYFIGLNSNIYTNSYHCRVTDKGEAASEKVAKSMLAMAMISQLMPYYGGMITDEEWGDANQCKFTIERDSSYYNNIVLGCRQVSYYFLAFHTPEQRNEFFEYNEQLVKDYLMID